VLEDPWFTLLVQLQDAVTVSTIRFWTARGLKTVHLPVTTGAVSSPMGLGSDSLPVRARILDVDTYLADSMQFMLEYACRLSPAGAYYLMPSFRGEENDDTHLSQFFHSEAELPVPLEDVMDVAEAYVRELARAILEGAAASLERHARGVAHLVRLVERRAPFTRLTFDDAAELLAGDGAAIAGDTPDARLLTRAGEQRLLREVDEFVWVTHWDHLATPFYQAFADPARWKARNADLLFGHGEVIGCGERHASGEAVLAALAHHVVDEAEYAWYVEMKARFPLLTSGFGMGVERFLMWVLRHDDIRDLQLAPRCRGAVGTP